jgi:hypothetical protein
MWNTELISSITLGTAAAVPIIVAIVQAFKMTGWIDEKYSPFLSMGVGIVVSFFLAIEARDWSANIIAGMLYGLAASGLYSGVKATAHAIRADKRKDIMKKNKL